MSSNRYANIDAMRGIAALLVVLQHSANSFILIPGIAKRGTLIAEISSSIDVGRIGVLCFFLISGFVIPFSLKKTTDKPIKRFIVRRFFRLYPAYWLSIIFILIVFSIRGQYFSIQAILANITMLQSFFSQDHIQGLYWTLQVELVFYLLCASMFYYGRLHKFKHLTLMCLGCFFIFSLIQCLAILSPESVVLHKDLEYMPYILSIMFLGSMYRKIYDKSANDRSSVIITVLCSCICFGFPLAVLLLWFVNIELTSDPIRFGISHALALILFLAGLVTLKKVPKILLWTGTISYSVYLFHPVVMHLLLMYTKATENHALQNLHLFVYILATMIISIALSSLVYILIERPAINFSYKF